MGSQAVIGGVDRTPTGAVGESGTRHTATAEIGEQKRASRQGCPSDRGVFLQKGQTGEIAGAQAVKQEVESPRAVITRRIRSEHKGVRVRDRHSSERLIVRRGEDDVACQQVERNAGSP